jgi:hypothetical protein
MRRCVVKPEPLWHRIARRRSWERGDPPRLSDFDPSAPVHAAINSAGASSRPPWPPSTRSWPERIFEKHVGLLGRLELLDVLGVLAYTRYLDECEREAMEQAPEPPGRLS